MGEKCDMFVDAMQLSMRISTPDWKQEGRKGEKEVKQTGRERATPCVSPTFDDREVTGEILAAAMNRCRTELCLTDDSTLEDTVLRLP